MQTDGQTDHFYESVSEKAIEKRKRKSYKLAHYSGQETENHNYVVSLTERGKIDYENLLLC